MRGLFSCLRPDLTNGATDMTRNWYLTTSIPYVNGEPHLGHALEFVHADVIARHLRAKGRLVRLQSGTDDHAIKNVSAASAADIPIQEFVSVNARRFEQVGAALEVQFDEFPKTSADVRHPPAVRSVWNACKTAGDLYRKEYAGLYCSGCDNFYSPDDLLDGLCPEHLVPPLTVSESNWFFRLSKYRNQILELIESRALLIEPKERRNEVLGFLRGEVLDISVSRPAKRTGGWGIPVPDDPDQVIYVWFDALINYISGLGFGSNQDEYGRWWASDTERVHIVGKGIVRFHAVYWIAFLLSAGLPLPTRIYVHDYLTVNGAKISKSGAQTASPLDLVNQYGSGALRWWLLSDPARVGTTDFTVDRLVGAYNRDLANGIGNLVSRLLALNNRERTWEVSIGEPESNLGQELLVKAAMLPAEIDKRIENYDFRSATQAICEISDLGNKFIESEAPWQIVKDAESGSRAAAIRFESTLDVLQRVCLITAIELKSFIQSGGHNLEFHLRSGKRLRGSL